MMKTGFGRAGDRKKWIAGALFVAAAGLMGASAAGQSSPPALGPEGFSASSTDDVGQYLGPIYKNELAGFEIAPPVGSRIITRAGLELVSFVNDAKQWGGSVQKASLIRHADETRGGVKGPSDRAQVMTFDEYMNSIGPELQKSFQAVQVLNMREFKFQGHDAGRIDSSMQAEVGGTQKGAHGEVIPLFRQQLVVKVSETDLLILTLFTPLKDRTAATTTFDAMLTSFRILDRTEIAKKLELSIKAGKEWLAQRTADELKSKLNNQPQLFRMKVGGADVGYLRFDESVESRNHMPGVMVAINSRGFPADGSTIYGKNESFWAFVGDAAGGQRPFYTMWDNTTKTVTNRPNVPRDAQTFWLREFGTIQLSGLSRYTDEELEGMRKHREELIRSHAPASKIPPPIEVPKKEYRIQVTYEADASQPPLQGLDGAIAIERAAPLPTVLEYLWPRVIDLTKPTEMTFVSYNSGLRKLTYRKLSVIGPDHIVMDRKPVDCVRCEDELEPNSTTLWVDSQGKILMMRTSDQSLLVPTTEDEMARLWAGRLK
ncbi:MAG: hypothetical protein ACTHN5_16940 [Phycisphaerae bacterium]